MKNKKTLVIGASTNPTRYAFMAVHQLRRNGHEVLALGKRQGTIADVPVSTEFPEDQDIHTVTMYVGPANQPPYYRNLIDLQPSRVIFNPGTENDELSRMLAENGIETVEGCTLVMLNSGRF